MTGGAAGADAVTSAGPAEQRYRHLIENSPDAICVHQAGRLVYLNAAGVRWMAATSADQLVGRPITDFVHPDSVPQLLASIASLRESGDASQPTDAVMLRLDGTTLEVEAISVLSVWDGRPAFQVVFRDPSAERHAQAALRFQAALVDHVSDAIIATTADGLVTAWNRAAEQIYRIAADRALGRPVSAVVGCALDPARLVAAGGRETATHWASDGGCLAIRVSAAAMDDGFVLLCTDQTALRRAEQHFETVVTSLEEGVVVIDGRRRLQSINPAARRILGIDTDELMDEYLRGERDMPVYDVDGNRIRLRDQPIMRTLRNAVTVTRHVLCVERHDGNRVWLSLNSRPLNPAEHNRSAVLLSFSDITAQRSATERLAYEATHDSLTGLPNRASVVNRLSRLAETGDTLAAVLFIDLDDFKTINDSLGHDAGDTVIQIAAERLRQALRADDVVGRLGGDEFVALVLGHIDRLRLHQLVTRLHDMLSEPIAIAGTTVYIGASIGVVPMADRLSAEPLTVLREADRAMYAAKAKGRRTSHYAVD
ncbi:diguanylate cyclase [Mycobacterium sp. MYCO198283]|uniref:diguanylate cyclase domain-containing protein n=1 Tax=Mycobacterium sp. MYCO198283 TaxID=2883505 RepID=UPI001E62B789|nr:diguanylate cyclase [Mycobacterium sp. MYCO198283]MCG5431496.1 diguanylate cyclase [Mycobacterium sp. MYCO198283]